MKTKLYYTLASLFAFTLINAATEVRAQSMSMTAPTASDVTIPYGTSFTPPYTGGSGGTTYVLCITDYTNWQTDSWTPPAPGTYTFFVGLLPSDSFGGNLDDPTIGNLESDGTLYTLTVVAPMTAPASSNITIAAGSSFTPDFTGGSGGTNYVFCVADYTNWQGGSWTPPGPGTYTFFVGLLPSTGYVGNLDDPTAGNLECDGTAYTITVE